MSESAMKMIIVNEMELTDPRKELERELYRWFPISRIMEVIEKG